MPDGEGKHAPLATKKVSESLPKTASQFVLALASFSQSVQSVRQEIRLKRIWSTNVCNVKI